MNWRSIKKESSTLTSYILRLTTNCGFTLIELLVSISIMVMIFSLGYANFRGFQRRQYLESAVRQVEAELRYAQELAISGNKPNTPPPPANPCLASHLEGYVFRRSRAYTAGPPELTAQYELYAACRTYPGAESYLIKGPIDLPNKVDLTFSPGPQNIMFQTLARGTDRASTNLVFTYVGSGLPTQTLTIHPSGRIE